jgi:hypothetical protein
MKAIGRILLAASLLACGVSGVTIAHVPTAARPMSVSNRLLLNRAMLRGQRQIEVMLACDPSVFDALAATAGSLGGTVRHVDRTVGYMRVELPLDNLAALIANPSIDAYQIASSSMAAWYRDGPPRANAVMFRDSEAKSVVQASSGIPDTLPPLTAASAQQAGYTADEDTGIERWMRAHPTFDGRGTTIAIIESALPEFSHPTLGTAKTLDGRDIDKLAGILNAIDPTEYDDTRVMLTTDVNATSTWTNIKGRTFILPRAGSYRFGILSVNAGGNLVHQFGVLRSQATAEIWVDTDGDADFRNEQPVLGIERTFQVRSLKITHPRETDLSFVVASSERPEILYIYLSRGGHQAMTLSVAAGARTANSLAYGVAPAAQVLLVRSHTDEARLSDFVEAYLTAAARPDVDVLSDSFGVALVPDTDQDFMGLLFRRMIETYKKPIFHSAGNNGPQLSSVSALGGAFSVGGTLGPATFAALYGGDRLPGLLVHPFSAAGPAMDGALKPDFLTPMERVAASVCMADARMPLPKNQPTSRLPACYRVSGGTSASGAYAAGVAALLISAAKQTGVNYSVDNLGRALRSSARFLPDTPAYEQGTGVLDVDGAWRELRRGIENPRISTTAGNHHAMTAYAAAGTSGVGLYETEGWTIGSRGVRMITLRRDAGPSVPTAYRVSWTGNDGTFATLGSVVLPLATTISLPVTIAPATAAVHSAILNLHEPEHDAIVFRSMATVLVPERLDSSTWTARVEGRVPLMKTASHFWEIPAHTAALSVELTVIRGAVSAGFVPPNGLASSYYEHKYPKDLERILPSGTYRYVIADPTAGVWGVNLTNDSALLAKSPTLVSTQEAQYSLSLRALGASLRTKTSDGQDTLMVSNRAGEIAEPTIRESWGTVTSHEAQLNRDGRANAFEIQVAPDASALVVSARMDDAFAGRQAPGRGLDLYLYDCTSGECFSYDYALPQSVEQRLVVRRPQAGRWVAMVNGALSSFATGPFRLETVVTTAKPRTTVLNLGRPLAQREERTLPIDANVDVPPSPTSVRVYELFDQAVDRSEAAQPWVGATGLEKLSGRPAALGIVLGVPTPAMKRALPSVQ